MAEMGGNGNAVFIRPNGICLIDHAAQRRAVWTGARAHLTLNSRSGRKDGRGARDSPVAAV